MYMVTLCHHHGELFGLKSMQLLLREQKNTSHQPNVGNKHRNHSISLLGPTII